MHILIQMELCSMTLLISYLNWVAYLLYSSDGGDFNTVDKVYKLHPVISRGHHKAEIDLNFYERSSTYGYMENGLPCISFNLFPTIHTKGWIISLYLHPYYLTSRIHQYYLVFAAIIPLW